MDFNRLSLCIVAVFCFLRVTDSSVIQIESLLRDEIRAPVADDNRTCMNKNTTLCWQSCNKIPSPIVVDSINLTSYPIDLTRGIIGFAKFNISRKVGITPIEIDFSVQMKIDGRFEDICFFVGEQNCFIRDLCSHKDVPCPLQGLTLIPISIDPIKLPLRIAGDFFVTVVARENGRDLGCLRLWFTLACKILPWPKPREKGHSGPLRNLIS